MKVFLSHARKDVVLAAQLAEQLKDRGYFEVWQAFDQIAPGDNWAKITGKALDDAEMMVVLLTPSALKSDSIRNDIEYALGSRKFEGRLFSVYVGPTLQVGKDVPWILLTLPHRQVESAKEFPEVAAEIRALRGSRKVRHANA